MISSDNILILDKDEKPIGLINKLELILETNSSPLVCKIHQVSEDNDRATHITDYTVGSIYNDGPITIIKLN